MTLNTINDAVTISGGDGTLLAGRYRIVRQLGQGGMGSVWLAEDTQLDNKQFAIKMLPSVLVSNKRAYNQLKSEALVAMKLTHSNIVTLRAFEENNGNPFLVMDYIEGQTLDDYLVEKGKLSEDETTRLLKPIAAALDYAHDKGIVHRDVKPANVMIRKDGHPFILDFGISREMQETMTRVTGKLSSGTLLYMSPEQLRGLPPKPAQDVYSFAAMTYECMSGHPPFSRGQIEFQILSEEPEPLPRGVCTASVISGLAKRPEDRPATCADVLSGDFLMQSSKDAENQGMRNETDCSEGRVRTSGAPKNGQKGVAGVFAYLGFYFVCLSILRKTFAKEGAKVFVAFSVFAVLVCGAWWGWAKYVGPNHGDVKTLTLPGGATMEMIYVGPGEFMMGSNDGDNPSESAEKTFSGKHKVKISKGYWLGKFEVTQAQWQSVMGDNPSYFKSGNRPVEDVSWVDCQKFIAKVDEAARRQFGGGARLPTEAEWEYACRAGTDSSLPNGQDLVVLGENFGRGLNSIAWYGGNSCVDFELSNGYNCSSWTDKEFNGSRAGTHPVGQKAANSWGFHDMVGNVWEFCNDWYGSDYYKNSPATDPQGPASGSDRVIRGGCWSNGARWCRSARRGWIYSDSHGGRYSCGFRLCCSALP